MNGCRWLVKRISTGNCTLFHRYVSILVQMCSLFSANALPGENWPTVSWWIDGFQASGACDWAQTQLVRLSREAHIRNRVAIDLWRSNIHKSIQWSLSCLPPLVIMCVSRDTHCEVSLELAGSNGSGEKKPPRPRTRGTSQSGLAVICALGGVISSTGTSLAPIPFPVLAMLSVTAEAGSLRNAFFLFSSS